MRSSDADGAVADLAAYQHGVITRSQAASLGMSASVLRRRVGAGLWRSPFPNVFVTASAQPSWHQEAMIATLAREGAVLPHGPAARLHGVDGFRDAPVEVSVVRSGPRYRRTDIDVHHIDQLPRADIVHVGAITATSLQRTLCDLGSAASR